MKEIFGFDSTDVAKIRDAVEVAKYWAHTDGVAYLPNQADPQVFLAQVVDRVVSGGAVRLDLVQVQIVTDPRVGSGIPADGATYTCYTRKIRDIGDQVTCCIVANQARASYSSSGSSSSSADYVFWQTVDDGPMLGEVVCHGPNGEADFADNHYWVQVARPEASGVLVAVQQGSSPTPIIVKVENLGEVNCSSHLVLPGTIVEFSAHFDQGLAGSTSGSAQNPTPHYKSQHMDDHACGLKPCSPSSSSSSSSSTTGSSSASSSASTGCACPPIPCPPVGNGPYVLMAGPSDGTSASCTLYWATAGTC